MSVSQYIATISIKHTQVCYYAHQSCIYFIKYSKSIIVKSNIAKYYIYSNIVKYYYNLK